MVKAEFVYEVLLTYDIDSEHTAQVRQRLIDEYGFQDVVKVSADGKSVIDYNLPESTLYHPHSSTDAVSEIFETVCKELKVTRLSCIATRCSEGRAIVI